jgi:hypothetical protein
MTEVADIFRRHGSAYRRKFGLRMPNVHLQAMRAIETCRTPALGGHLYQCTECGKYEYSYHSCKNRSCPKCQNHEATLWLHAQEELLLPVPYFMITFTLPDELRELARSNQKRLYGLFFRASANALRQMARDTKYLGGLIGMVGVLQTWTRDMTYHPHIHYLVPGGALSPDADTWIAPKYKDWLLPVKALSKLFRGKFKAMLKRAGLLDAAPPSAWKKPWTVHCEPVGTGREVIRYLAPYIRRIAITNPRIKKLADGLVTFRVKKTGSTTCKEVTVSAEEFIRRFLQHVLPRGFQKIRYYGLLSPSRRDRLHRARAVLGDPDPEPASEPPPDQHGQNPDAPANDKLHRCRKCGAPLYYVGLLEPSARAPPSAAAS